MCKREEEGNRGRGMEDKKIISLQAPLGWLNCAKRSIESLFVVQFLYFQSYNFIKFDLSLRDAI